MNLKTGFSFLIAFFIFAWQPVQAGLCSNFFQLLKNKIATMGSSKNRSDWFLENPPQQPKREIALYVSSQGVQVPTLFEGIDEALESGREFIIRSEHPQEYQGMSGVLQSHLVSKEDLVFTKNLIDEGRL